MHPVISVHSVHSRAVPAAPGAAGHHAETAAGAEPTAAASQQPCNNHQHTGQSGWTRSLEPFKRLGLL